ncbi:group 1 glycosyl transferase [Rivularia sp. IAM M-261]|nr:group 1 glycosyl transferase [Calothrix sp. PCC 7716]GJD15382.1 group 1 glycosyl transferase [Rivularia sp. IAM M-261]
MKSHPQGLKKTLPQFTLSKLESQRYNTIKLSVITQFFPPDFAATGQLIDELVRQLGSFGVDIDVFTGQPGYAFQTSEAPAIEKWNGVTVKRSRTSQLWPKRVRGKAMNGVLFVIRAALHLLRHYRRRNVLLVTTAPPFLPFLGYLAHLFTGIPYICLLYDLYPDIAIALGVIPQNHWLAKIWQNLNIRVWRRAKEIVVLSPNMKERIVNICPDIKDKIYVIHSWANSKAIVPIAKKENWFAWKHNLVDKFTVLYSGNMGRCHDMDTIIEAAKELKDEPIQFVFIGGGAKREEVMQQATCLGLSNLIFLPYQDKHVLPYSLTACDLSLVSVDMAMESLVAPSKLYPALAAGRPVAVICSKHSYLRELITDARCGTSFENGDGHGLAEYIRLLNSNRQLVEHMGKEGREYLQTNFTPEVISKEYFKVISKSIT